MATHLSIHIGPSKTGTTSVQHALATSREALAAQGVLYPDLGRGAAHQAAVLDLAGLQDSAVRLESHVEFYRSRTTAYLGCWQRLLDLTRQHDGPVVWSDEAFPMIGDWGVDAMARALVGIPVRIVSVNRLPSRRIPSLYPEICKRSISPDFEVYLRGLAGATLAGVTYEADDIDEARRHPLWTKPGWEHVVIDAKPDLRAEHLDAVMAALLPAGVVPPEVPWRNEAMSVSGVMAWRHHMRTQRPHYGGALLETLAWFVQAHPAVTDRNLGGRFTLEAKTASLLDEAFGRASDAEPAPSTQARELLRLALAKDDPLTAVVEGTMDPRDPEWLAVVAALPARQRRSNARWRAIDLATRVLRRPRPLGGVHDLTAVE